MGEPLNFVAGGERLFKNYLRELLVDLCMEGNAMESVGIARGDGIPTRDEGSWALVRAHKSHDVTRMSQAVMRNLIEAQPDYPNAIAIFP